MNKTETRQKSSDECCSHTFGFVPLPTVTGKPLQNLAPIMLQGIIVVLACKQLDTCALLYCNVPAAKLDSFFWIALSGNTLRHNAQAVVKQSFRLLRYDATFPLVILN